jgi:pimeloyl-ACP methyl ester carboxylesterase
VGAALKPALKPLVLCIHSFASSSRQYRALEKRLDQRFRVVAGDLCGHGERAAWNGAWRFTLADEAAPFEALLPEEPPVHLVGHSYGGAVALRIAAMNRTGAGAWAATPAERRPRLLGAIRSLRDGWLASFIERWSICALRSLDIPCLLLTGTRSTAAARRALGLLRDALPRAQVLELAGLGHLGPISDPQRVDAEIEAFLVQRASKWAPSPQPEYAYKPALLAARGSGA